MQPTTGIKKEFSSDDYNSIGVSNQRDLILKKISETGYPTKEARDEICDLLNDLAGKLESINNPLFHRIAYMTRLLQVVRL